MEYMPVCAKGKTYSNGCMARCAGAQQQDIKPGACSSAAVVLPSTGPTITRTKPAKGERAPGIAVCIWS
jgi:hypothetical protein